MVLQDRQAGSIPARGPRRKKMTKADRIAAAKLKVAQATNDRDNAEADLVRANALQAEAEDKRIHALRVQIDARWELFQLEKEDASDK